MVPSSHCAVPTSHVTVLFSYLVVVDDQKFYMIAHSMKSKERPSVLTKEGQIHEVKKDHEGPKSQKEGKKKEMIIIIKKNEEDLSQVRGHVARIPISGYAARRASRP